MNCIIFASNKISRLCKLKCSLPVIKRNHLIYQVTCKDCHEFYIGLTNRRLKTKLNEHKPNENSALFRHSFLTDHEINYSNPKILATEWKHRFVQAEPVVIILCNPTKSIPKLCTFYILSYTSQLRKGIVHS